MILSMERESLPRELRPFVDDRGRLKSWPARLKVQRMACVLLAERFGTGREYSENEANALLMDAHIFADWALLRRSLVDWGFLDREPDGTRYRRRADAPETFEALEMRFAGR